MLKKYLVIFLECSGMQILFSVLSMLFFVGFIPTYIYSIFTAWLLIWALHSTFWQLGNREGKMHIIRNKHLVEDGKETEKPEYLKGALFALPHLSVNLILLLSTYLTNTDILVTITTALHFPFVGFLPELTNELGTDYLISRTLVCLAMYIPCVTAYISGYFQFSLIDKYFHKIIYKTPKNN